MSVQFSEEAGQSGAVQTQAGYAHTLREIRQQPETWRETARLAVARRDEVEAAVGAVQAVVLTGSGSSQFAGQCVDLALQRDLGVPVQTLGGGDLLTHAAACLPPLRPCLLVSLARSGNSPESAAAVEQTQIQGVQQLAITCNGAGALAQRVGAAGGTVLALADRTNDRSLVMTSSFTNMVVAARFLGLHQQPDRYLKLVEQLSTAAELILRESAEALQQIAQQPFRRVLYLGSGCRYGAAREAALKMLEMTAGRVVTMADSFLGLRHGPMSAVHEDTLVVGLLSSDPLRRAYELDLLRELDTKELGSAKVIVGHDVPADVIRPGDLVAETGTCAIADDDAAVLDVLAGQLLAFARCRQEGLQPDSPSVSGVITRVVPPFRIHEPAGESQ